MPGLLSTLVNYAQEMQVLYMMLCLCTPLQCQVCTKHAK